MKKKVMILVSILLSVGSVAHSDDKNTYESKIGEGIIVNNGTAWVKFDLLSKVFYVKGLSLGITTGGGVIQRSFNLLSDKDKEKGAKALDEITPKGTFTEVVGYIDNLYKNPANREATILDAYICMAFEQNGKIDKNNRDTFLQRTISSYKQ